GDRARSSTTAGEACRACADRWCRSPREWLSHLDGTLAPPRFPRLIAAVGRPSEKGKAMLNVVALVGRLARPAEPRELPSGDRFVAYEVTVTRESGKAETVPVVWFQPPASAGDYDVDEKVVVVGRVRRR